MFGGAGDYGDEYYDEEEDPKAVKAKSKQKSIKQ